MNILVLYQSPWWNAASYYVLNLVKILQQNGHKIIFAGKSGLPASIKIVELNIELKDIDLSVVSPFSILQNINKIKKIIIDSQIELLLPISAPGHIAAGIIKKIYNKNLPILKVCLDNVPPVNNFLNKYLHNKLTDFFIFPGNTTKIRYDNIFNINNYQFLHAPIDVDKFLDFSTKENFKKKMNLPEDKLIISFIGRFSPEKGIFFLLEIIKTVLQENDNIFFILSGSEEQVKYKDVQEKADEIGIGNSMKIIDKVDDVRELLSITDIGLLSSRYSEYICRIAMEFMCFKKPVIGPDLNVIPEVVEHDKTGFIYNLNDSQMAANFIIKLANDKNLLKTMGENGYKRILDNYNYATFSHEIEKIIKSLL